MKKDLNILLDEELLKKFEMALTLNNENKETVVDMLLKSYISRAFSQAAALYDNSFDTGVDNNEFYGKALYKIPKWAKKPSQAIYKIIRAYFQLAEAGSVYYSDLAEYCGDKTREDVYMPSFATNFAQMKFDGEKSYGKVFEVGKDGLVTIWDYVETQIYNFKESFTMKSTDLNYLNKNNQRNIGKTDEKGTDHCSVLYMMRCEDCKHEYFANSTDIHLKKCPNCQGGADTGAK